MELQLSKKVFLLILLLALAVVSFLMISDWASDAGTYTATLNSINEKADTVLKLSAASALASAGISAIPGDTATPIAEKLADFTEYFLLVLCVLFTEKYLMTILGAAVFKILIPVALLCVGVCLFCRKKSLLSLAIKLAAFGLALFLVIPASFRVSDMIYHVYDSSIERTIASAEELTEKTSSLTEAEEDKGLVASVLERISETAATLTDKAADILNRFVETLAVIIVTSCLIPILVLLFFLWVVKQLTGLELTGRLRALGRKNRATGDGNDASASQ